MQESFTWRMCTSMLIDVHGTVVLCFGWHNIRHLSKLQCSSRAPCPGRYIRKDAWTVIIFDLNRVIGNP